MRLAWIPAAVALAVNLAACAPVRETRGYVLNERAVASLAPGRDTRDTVLTTLGTPSATGTFQPNRWYYISAQTEQVAYKRAEVLDQQVVAIDFTDRGVVADIQRYTMADAMKIDPVDRVTPTRGRELNVLEQLLGNIGRFTPTTRGGNR